MEIWKVISERFFFNKFRQNLLVLTSGNVVIQVISITSYPILTRLYSADTFGQFALFNSIVLLTGVLITLRYETGIPLMGNIEEAKFFRNLLFYIPLIFSLILTIVAFVAQKQGYLTTLGNFIYAIPLVGFVSSQFEVKRLWHLLTDQIFSYYRVMISYRALYVLFAIGLSLGASKIENGLISGLISASLLMFFIVIPTNLFTKFDWSQAQRLLRSNYRYPKYSLPSVILFNLSNQVPIFLITKYFDVGMTGQYAVAFNLLFIPNALLMARVSESLYVKFASSEVKDIRAVVVKIWKYVALIMTIPCIILFIYGEEMSSLILGSKWSTAGQIAEHFAVIIFLSAFNASVSSVINVLNLQHIQFRISAYRLFYMFASFLMAGYFNDLFLGIKLMVVFGVVQQVAFGYNIYYNLNRSS